MQTHYAIKFADLPISVRQRLTDAINAFNQNGAAPVAFAIKATESGLPRWVVWILKALVLWFVWIFLDQLFFASFGRLGDSGAVQPWSTSIFEGVLIGVVFSFFLDLWPLHHRPRLPFEPGVYFFANAIVDAKSPLVHIFSTVNLKKFEATHLNSKYGYTHTKFEFHLADGRKETFKIANKIRAEKSLEGLQLRSRELQSAVQTGDVAQIALCDPLMTLRESSATPLPVGGVIQRALATVQRSTMLVGIAAGLLLGQPLWLVRNLLSDRAQFEQAMKQDTEVDFKKYLESGWRYREQAQSALAPAALKDAVKAGTISGLRSVLARYPKAGYEAEVGKHISVIYANAFERFKSQAGESDPSLLLFVKSLLSHLESTGNPQVQVRFTRPDSASLARIDSGGLLMAPAATHFGNANASARETRMVSELAKGFKSLFPADVLSLVQSSTQVATRPLLQISYQVNPSGKVYTSDKNVFKFVGVIVKFDVNFTVPETAVPWRAKLEVLPPDHFTVKNNGNAFAMDNGAVYAEMADRAFDQLGSKFKSAFFAHPPTAKVKGS